ncbi:hypothetical protein J3A83DRAFT_4375255 [Scleroderma citrinum]
MPPLLMHRAPVHCLIHNVSAGHSVLHSLKTPGQHQTHSAYTGQSALHSPEVSSVNPPHVMAMSLESSPPLMPPPCPPLLHQPMPSPTQSLPIAYLSGLDIHVPSAWNKPAQSLLSVAQAVNCDAGLYSFSLLDIPSHILL